MENYIVTIITVVYNGDKYIESTIKSVLEQTYEKIEYIVIDGGSTDMTIDIVNKYVNRIDYFTSEPDRSMYDAINKGLKIAKGDFILILNSDDYLFKRESISEAVKEINKLNIKGTASFYGNLYIEEDGKIDPKITFQVSFKKLLLSKHGTFVPHPTLLVSKEAFKKVGMYNLEYKYASDFDYILNLIRYTKVVYISIPITVFRRHSQSITSSGKLDDERDRILYKHGYYNFNLFSRITNFFILWSYYKISNGLLLKKK
ncbi:glycosyltransferase [Siphonobacter sp. BAB-5385]|uniref:glycosyltransferase family 2 protein n=1 Tax=Siphonobacter sp. BAB-5385 TaxID=1864822 RepID=UPI000B9E06DC|nr:glycosyltransferase family 2 protein [Siphonobacter sp. BAB-5385]OZI07540.1 glycosyltransferase [Siphonobacter sp. BAB-5385]